MMKVPKSEAVGLDSKDDLAAEACQHLVQIDLAETIADLMTRVAAKGVSITEGDLHHLREARAVRDPLAAQAPLSRPKNDEYDSQRTHTFSDSLS